MNPHDDASRVAVERVVEALREFEENKLSDIRKKSRE